MGAEVAVVDVREVGGETVADVRVKSAALHGTDVPAAAVPSLVDEVPILAVAATLAEGETTFHGLGELRLKEVDRVAAVADQLRLMGASIAVEGDDLTVAGAGRLAGAEVSSGGDHRMAMSLAIAATLAAGASQLTDPNAADVSYPDFYAELSRLTV
jgi:3-phosphoshikimate 1-carboxyvinyltransferase